MENKIERYVIINQIEYSPLEMKLLDLLEDGPMVRDEMVKRLGIPRTTIYDALKRLIKKKHVRKYNLCFDNMPRGRPKVLFTLVDD